jgi:hypothetical protein
MSSAQITLADKLRQASTNLLQQILLSVPLPVFLHLHITVHHDAMISLHLHISRGEEHSQASGSQ